MLHRLGWAWHPPQVVVPLLVVQVLQRPGERLLRGLQNFSAQGPSSCSGAALRGPAAPCLSPCSAPACVARPSAAAAWPPCTAVLARLPPLCRRAGSPSAPWFQGSQGFPPPTATDRRVVDWDQYDPAVLHRCFAARIRRWWLAQGSCYDVDCSRERVVCSSIKAVFVKSSSLM